MNKTPFNILAHCIHRNAVSHGWWENDRPPLELLMLANMELAEAGEEFRDGNPAIWYKCHRLADAKCTSPVCEACEFAEPDADGRCIHAGAKPEGWAVELIDAVIRILDHLAHEDIDIDAVLNAKMEYNITREYRHGGKVY